MNKFSSGLTIGGLIPEKREVGWSALGSEAADRLKLIDDRYADETDRCTRGMVDRPDHLPATISSLQRRSVSRKLWFEERKMCQTERVDRRTDLRLLTCGPSGRGCVETEQLDLPRRTRF